nr:hypothetical protein CKG001_10360 [Bdellovibrio sp. CKG001]
MRQKGLSQRQLAKNAKINYENFNRLMKGGRSIVKSDVLPLVAAELGVTQDDLMHSTLSSSPANTSKEQLIGEILVRLSTLNEDQLRAASTGINNAILAATSSATLRGKKSSTGT